MGRRLINIQNVGRNRQKDPLTKYYTQTGLGERTLVLRHEPGFRDMFGNLVDDRLYISGLRDFAVDAIRNNLPHIIWNAGGTAEPEGEFAPADPFDFGQFVFSAFGELHSATREEAQRELGRSSAANNPYVYDNEDGTLSSLSGELIDQVVLNSLAIIQAINDDNSGLSQYLQTRNPTEEIGAEFNFYLFLGFLNSAPDGEELSTFIFGQLAQIVREGSTTFRLVRSDRDKSLTSNRGRQAYIDSFPENTSVRDIIRDLITRIQEIQNLSEARFNGLKDYEQGVVNNSVQYSTRATLIRFYYYMLSVAMIKSMPQDKQYLIQDALLSPSADTVREYNHLNLTIENPYVTTKKTQAYLTDRVSDVFQGGYEAGIKSSYNNYYPEYELGVSSSQINDEVVPYDNALPNAYIRNIFIQPDSNVPVIQKEKYDTFITLDKRIANNVATCRGNLTADYYNTYGSVVSNRFEGVPRFNRVVASQIGAMTRNVVIPSSESDMFSEVMRNRFTNPMFTQVSFTREPVGDVGRQMWENNISSPILSTILQGGQPSRSFREVITTYIATSGSSAGEQLESSFVRYYGVRGLELSMRVFDPAVLIQNASNAGVGDVLVLMENKPFNTPGGPREKDEPYQQGVLTANQASRCTNILRDIERRGESFSNLAYNSILNDNHYITPSEVLAYRINKTDPSRANSVPTQNIIIGNSPETQASPLVTSYIDTQIMYGREYKYDLHEYRVVYGTKYKLAAIAPLLDLTMVKNILPIATKEEADRTLSWLVYESGLALNAQLKFEFYVDEEPDISIYEIPIYQDEFYRQVRITAPFAANKPGGTSYPKAKVLDRPPSPPEVNFFPLVGNASQFAININPQIGSYIGKNALEVVSIGDAANNLEELYEYQSEFTNYELPEGKLEFANESIRDVKNIAIYRTTRMDFDVESYNELYKSFDPNTNDKVLVRRFSTDRDLRNQSDMEVQYVRSYDVLDNLSPNVDYFYTVVVHDRHGNVSNPSQIYRIKLVLDKGLIVPEIDRVEPRKISTKTATKNLTRFVKIEASNIQSLPTIQQDGDRFIGVRSLASSLGESVEDQTMVVRFTSKDTGKIFDLKINFIVKVDGENIGGQT